MKTNQQTSIKRSEFLRSLGLSSGALMAFYCMGTLTSCSKGSDEPDPEPTPDLDVTLDLTQADYRALQTIGGYSYYEDILIARVKNGGYVALSKICTHQASNVMYRAATDDIFCPTHGSEYTTAGVVTVPAASGQKNLTQYKTTVTGNSLRITS